MFGMYIDSLLFIPSVKNSQRYAHQIQQLQSNNSDIRIKKVGRLSFSKQFKIADGSNGTQIFTGLLDDQKPVAVKRLNQGFEAKDETVWNVLGESGLESKYLLRQIVSEEDDDFVYLALPLCEYNLEEVIENDDNPFRTKLTAKSRASMCDQLMRGVAELHQANVLHRDLKPRNVLLGKWIYS